MGKIIPRWEWRTFGEDLDSFIKEIQSHSLASDRESKESYILSRVGSDNIKIRDQLLDIKSPLRINDKGLEQWTVLMKASFPVHINDLALVYKAFNIKLPYLEKDEYSYDEFIDVLVKTQEDLLIVQVEKRRFGYEIDGAIVEVADVIFNGKKLNTIAVEHENPHLVLKVLDRFNLNEMENLNYIEAMKRIFNFK